jgi:hypothetical protein
MRCFAKVLTASSCFFFASLLGAPIANAADGGRLASSANVSSGPENAAQPAGRLSASAQETTVERYGDLPLSFEANQGQTDRQVRFVSRGSGYSFFLTQTGAVLSFSRDSHSDSVLRMQLAGASPRARIRGLDELPGKSNYFLGSDARRWRTGVPTYSRAAYENVYPGISLVYYGNQRQLEYDFVVAPGADPGQIRLTVSGVQKLTVDAQGNLVMRSAAGEVQLLAPKVYQQIDGQKQEIAGQWKLEADHVAGFRLGTYDHTHALVIDPVLQYSSFLGGSQKNALSKIAIDAAGNAYVAGYTASGDFPAAPSPQSLTFGAGAQSRGAFVAKIDPTGSNLLYSTYLSGSIDEEATGLAVDNSGNLYVAGSTHSPDFPTRNAFQSACATRTHGGTCSSAFLSKIGPSGDSLLFSTYLGGSGGESARSLVVDANGSAYVAGVTSSLDFPVTAGAAQTKCGGTCQQNAFVAKFNATGDSLAYASYLGGSAIDVAADLAVDSSGAAYLAGRTTSADFPLAAPYQKACTLDAASSSGACVATAFVAKIKSDGSGFAYSTYLGGSLGGQASAIAVDSLGSAYVTGSTQSADFPVWKAFQKSCGIDLATGKCSVDAFLTKFAPSGNTLVYSTYLGGSGRDEASGIVVDAAGNAHIVGRTESPDFPTVASLQSQLKGNSDAFAVRFNAAGSALTFSTYHGGSATESGNGIALDTKGNIYLAGETSSPDFPTHHPFQSSCAGACTNAFVTKMALPPANSAPTITSPATTTLTVGTAGSFTVTTTGTPVPAINDGGFALPSGVGFVDNGNGTGNLSGTPATGTGGAYSFTFTASNGVLPDATQPFTLNVDEAPTVIGASNLTCTVGTACSTLMSTTGFPMPTLGFTGTLPNGITFVDNLNGTGTLGGTAAVGSGGNYTTVAITASNAAGAAIPHPVNPIIIREAPAFLSGTTTTFTVGTAGTFSITTRGFPRPALTETGALPTGVTFTDNGNGSATLAGTPATGTDGTYLLTLKATNTVSTATQTFTLQVNAGPAITSTNNTTFTVGTAGTFTVTATGTPAPVLSETGALPTGVTFNAGTGVLAGTPAVGSGGVYTITFKATNTAGTTTQTFTLTVDEGPAFTSGTSTTFVTGTAGTFTVTATGTPAPTFTESGALPSGVTFNASTQVLGGTPASGTGGTYAISFTAHNGITADATQNFTLTVDQPPAITSTATATFQAGVAGTFTVAATGFPAPTLRENGALPSGVSFNAGTGVLSGTPAAGTGGIYTISFTAQNGVNPAATQPFTLLIKDFTVLPAPASVSIVQGFASSNIALNINSVQNYSAAQLNLACSGLPSTGSPAPSCGFSANPVALAAGGTVSPPFSVSLMGQTVTSGLTAPGTYSVAVTATDGATALTEPASSNFTLTVVQNQPPVCGLTAGTPLVQVQQNSPLDVTVTATCADPENSATSVINFGDGTTASGTSAPDHTYAAPGSYVVAVTMTDNVAQTSTVAEGLTFAPAVNLTTAQTSTVQTIAVQAPTAASLGTSVTLACTQVSLVGVAGSGKVPSAYGIACAFTPNAQVTLSSSSSTGVTITTSAPASKASLSSNPRTRPWMLPLYATGLGIPAMVLLGFGVQGIGTRRQRTWRQRLIRLLPVLLVLSLLLGSLACGGGFTPPGGGTNGTTNPGAYSVTVAGTDSNNNVLTSIIIPLNVTH